MSDVHPRRGGPSRGLPARRFVRAVAGIAAVAALATACGTGSATADHRSAPATPADAQVASTGRSQVLAARSSGELPVFAGAGDADAVTVLPGHDELGSPLVLLVLDVDHRPDGSWLEVLLPGRPNGHTGWVPAATVALNEVEHEVRVDLARRELRVMSGETTLLTTPAAVGDPDHPTPTGRFSITNKLMSTDPGGLYGPYALGLSGRSDVLTEFAGSDGQIGIHGTNVPSSIGQAASHGCIRVPNDVVTRLNDLLALGTPVVIS